MVSTVRTFSQWFWIIYVLLSCMTNLTPFHRLRRKSNQSPFLLSSIRVLNLDFFLESFFLCYTSTQAVWKISWWNDKSSTAVRRCHRDNQLDFTGFHRLHSHQHFLSVVDKWWTKKTVMVQGWAKIKSLRGMGRPWPALRRKIMCKHSDSWWGKRRVGVLEYSIKGSMCGQGWVQPGWAKQVES